MAGSFTPRHGVRAMRSRLTAVFKIARRTPYCRWTVRGAASADHPSTRPCTSRGVTALWDGPRAPAVSGRARCSRPEQARKVAYPDSSPASRWPLRRRSYPPSEGPPMRPATGRPVRVPQRSPPPASYERCACRAFQPDREVGRRIGLSHWSSGPRCSQLHPHPTRYQSLTAAQEIHQAPANRSRWPLAAARRCPLSGGSAGGGSWRKASGDDPASTPGEKERSLRPGRLLRDASPGWS